jgi:CheY-like chemotaxis protein
LIADDNPVSRRLLVSSLEKWGFDPVPANDGREAWGILEGEDPPRMVILDWMMPEIEGPEVVRRLRRREEGNEPGKTSYVILLTSKETADDIVEGFSAGSDDYVTKPFNREELKVRVFVGARMLDLRRRLADRVRELEIALERVETLQGLLPICSYCKKIREDRGYWTDVESYFERYSAAEFSHGVCPDCYETHLRPGLEEMRNPGKAPEITERSEIVRRRDPDGDDSDSAILRAVRPGGDPPSPSS